MVKSIPPYERQLAQMKNMNNEQFNKMERQTVKRTYPPLVVYADWVEPKVLLIRLRGFRNIKTKNGESVILDIEHEGIEKSLWFCKAFTEMVVGCYYAMQYFGKTNTIPQRHNWGIVSITEEEFLSKQPPKEPVKEVE